MSTPAETEKLEREALCIATQNGPTVLCRFGLKPYHFTPAREVLFHSLCTAAREAPGGGHPLILKVKALLENEADSGIPAAELPLMLAEFTDGIGDPAHAEWYAREVVNAWNARECRRAIDEMNAALAEGDMGRLDALRRKLDTLRARGDGLPVPVPISERLAPVPELSHDMIPAPLRTWLTDAAQRIGCPLVFLAVGAIVTAGAIVGRKVGIRPKERDDWTEYPILWGALIGRPSAMKSPALNEAMRPLSKFEARAREEHEAAMQEHRKNAARSAIERDAARDNARKAARKGISFSVESLLPEESAEPALRRYTVNKTSLQALVEILRENPNGLLLTHDELSGLLAQLDQPGNEDMRAFYLTAWNGKDSFTLDTIGRGLNHHLPAFCLSMLGGIQPARLSAHVREAVNNGAGDDGFVQRLQLAVWPDDPGEWRAVDRWPDTGARQEAFATFEALDALNPQDIGAEYDEQSGAHFLRFEPELVPSFLEWMENITARARSEAATIPAMEAHLIKYRSLLPRLALLFHLLANGRGTVSAAAYNLALRWTEFLEAHARRIYSQASAPDIDLAARLLARLPAAIREGRIREPFQARDIYKNGWSGLTESKAVAAALELLAAHYWILEEPAAPRTGGRPAAQLYTLHPAAHQKHPHAPREAPAPAPTKPTKPPLL